MALFGSKSLHACTPRDQFRSFSNGKGTWATTKRQEKRIEVNEMRMLRWMCGVTRKDKIRNEHIRGTTRVAHASKRSGKVRRDEEHILRKVLRMDVEGKRTEIKMEKRMPTRE